MMNYGRFRGHHKPQRDLLTWFSTSRHSLLDPQVCLETLKELAVTDPRVVAHANGFRVLLAAAIDPANQVRCSGPAIVMCYTDHYKIAQF